MVSLVKSSLKATVSLSYLIIDMNTIYLETTGNVNDFTPRHFHFLFAPEVDLKFELPVILKLDILQDLHQGFEEAEAHQLGEPHVHLDDASHPTHPYFGSRISRIVPTTPHAPRITYFDYEKTQFPRNRR